MSAILCIGSIDQYVTFIVYELYATRPNSDATSSALAPLTDFNRRAAHKYIYRATRGRGRKHLPFTFAVCHFGRWSPRVVFVVVVKPEDMWTPVSFPEAQFWGKVHEGWVCPPTCIE